MWQGPCHIYGIYSDTTNQVNKIKKHVSSRHAIASTQPVA